MNELVIKIKAALAKYRLTFSDEAVLQAQVEEILSCAGIGFVREHPLAPGERPDFWLAPYCLEIKVGGSINTHLRQMQRYNRHKEVAGTILICTKPFGRMLPETLAGKPVAAINIGGQRL